MHLKIATVVGARPQFIKASAVSRAITEWNESEDLRLMESIIHTGQHYDAEMSDVFFVELGIPAPSINLNVGSGSHATQTGAMLVGLEKEFLETKPDCVLVYGDTNSTLAAALTAAKMGIPLAHVEAGLRSENRKMPEEINRIVADRLSDLLFTATKAAENHLRAEGLSRRVRVVGDVMFDCIRLHGNTFRSVEAVFKKLRLPSYRQYVLSTIHRAENTDNAERLEQIFAGLSRIATMTPVILPLHPRTASMVGRGISNSALAGINLVEPIGFLDMMTLEAGAQVIVTDSGGVQKEAYIHGAPCVTVRDETEWVETVESGWNVLCEPNVESIATKVGEMLRFDRGTPRPNFYGDGRSSQKIVAHLATELRANNA
jgi:UDP-GlcNAc3NAcA epimerase